MKKNLRSFAINAVIIIAGIVIAVAAGQYAAKLHQYFNGVLLRLIAIYSMFRGPVALFKHLPQPFDPIRHMLGQMSQGMNYRIFIAHFIKFFCHQRF